MAGDKPGHDGKDGDWLVRDQDRSNEQDALAGRNKANREEKKAGKRD